MTAEPDRSADPILGAVPHATGTRFALFSAHATAVELCLFDTEGHETGRVPLSATPGGVWTGDVEGVGPGHLYGYRVHGPYEPSAGHRFNPGKLLLDPYALQVSGELRQDESLFGYDRASAVGPDSFGPTDSAAFVPKAIVTARPLGARTHARPRRAWPDTVIYEAHVRGLTTLHPAIPASLRGTYEALGHPALVGHLLRLGITALELLPIHLIADEPAVAARGLRNYWGYSTLGYFAPAPRYYGPDGPDGLRRAVATLHENGIEVILDVVYNHTAEGEDDGPTLSFRGIDNASYYKHRPDEPGRLWDATGCGNTLDLACPRVRQLAIDSLRHWADAYGIDGFRFDLATALARDPYDFSSRSAFFDALESDPVLGSLKLIAEPWDIGEAGYRLGQFPAGWAEWNDRVRDTTRAFWRGDDDQLPRLTQALTGSKEIFARSGRGPVASVNYVASHDGFTLRDVVSYERKHNEANGEGDRDGHGNNLSDNHGVEGETDDPTIRAERARSARAMLATILLAQGVPMLLAGDELWRTQGGNNNPYCQDNLVSWIDWDAGRLHDPDLPDFVARLIATRRRFAGLRRDRFLTGERLPETGLRDVYWLEPSGRWMEPADWADRSRRVVGMQLGNEAADEDRLLLLVNGSKARAPFRLAPGLPGRAWVPILATNTPTGAPDPGLPTLRPGGTFVLEPRSMVLFQPQP